MNDVGESGPEWVTPRTDGWVFPIDHPWPIRLVVYDGMTGEIESDETLENPSDPSTTTDEDDADEESDDDS